MFWKKNLTVKKHPVGWTNIKFIFEPTNGAGPFTLFIGDPPPGVRILNCKLPNDIGYYQFLGPNLYLLHLNRVELQPAPNLIPIPELNISILIQYDETGILVESEYFETFLSE